MLQWKPHSPFEEDDWKETITPADWQMVEILREAGNAQLTNFPTTAIKDIRTAHNKQALAITGKVFAMSDVEPDPESMKYLCLNCGVKHKASEKTGEPPKKCLCGQEEFEPLIEEAKNMQVYRVQDGNSVISALAKDDFMLNAAKPGQSIYAFGVLKHRAVYDRSMRQMRFKKYLELANLQTTQKNDVELTREDVERFIELAKQPEHYQRLIDSFACHLVGLVDAKELCVIVISSQGIARPLNGFLGGPPATGKTQLLEYSAMMSANGYFTNITNASLAGLTSAVDEDEETGMRITKPGLFVMADRGLVCITELQALGEKNAIKTSLNDALERKEVASAKADGAFRLQARCAVLIDSNNYLGSWDYERTLAENLKFMQPNLAAFLSRLDLITITERITDEKTNRAIARANYNAYFDTEDPFKKFQEDWIDVDGNLRYGFNTLRKYFAYVTSLPLPHLSREDADMFEQNYVDATKNNADFLVDGRYNRAIILIAKCRARLLLRQQVERSDILAAIRMVNKSKDIETKTADGSGRDANAALGLKDAVKLNMEETFWKCFNSLKKKEKILWHEKETEIEYVSEGELQYELTQKEHWMDSKAREYIRKLKHFGRLMEEFGAGRLTSRE